MRFGGMNFLGLNVMIRLCRTRDFGIDDNQSSTILDFLRATLTCDGYHGSPAGMDADADCR
jgi:hypothetical protein